MFRLTAGPTHKESGAMAISSDSSHSKALCNKIWAVFRLDDETILNADRGSNLGANFSVVGGLQ